MLIIQKKKHAIRCRDGMVVDRDGMNDETVESLESAIYGFAYSNITSTS